MLHICKNGSFKIFYSHVSTKVLDFYRHLYIWQHKKDTTYALKFFLNTGLILTLEIAFNLHPKILYKEIFSARQYFSLLKQNKEFQIELVEIKIEFKVKVYYTSDDACVPKSCFLTFINFS